MTRNWQAQLGATRVPRGLDGGLLAVQLAWRAQNSFVCLSGTLRRVAGTQSPAGPVICPCVTLPTQRSQVVKLLMWQLRAPGRRPWSERSSMQVARPFEPLGSYRDKPARTRGLLSKSQLIDLLTFCKPVFKYGHLKIGQGGSADTTPMCDHYPRQAVFPTSIGC